MFTNFEFKKFQDVFHFDIGHLSFENGFVSNEWNTNIDAEALVPDYSPAKENKPDI